MKLRFNIITACLALVLFACETEIHPELRDAERILVIDAWINDKAERQEIFITRSQPYFENSFPQKVSGAIVVVEDVASGTEYSFVEGADSYSWDGAGTTLGEAGHEYKLSVTVDGETFEAYSRVGRVPEIDTIKFHFNKADLLVKEDYYTAEFISRDPAGVGDTYWIKAWKNDVYLGKPAELNMAYDAGFTPGQSIDGQVFILPIRKDFINPLDKITKDKNEFFPPYSVGDSVTVEIHSINNQAFDFLFALYYQITRPGGFAELFSMPLANSGTNLRNTNANSRVEAAGFFNVALVSRVGQKLTEQLAEQVRQGE